MFVRRGAESQYQQDPVRDAHTDQEYVPLVIDLENLKNTSETFLATAQSSDLIRARIEEEFYDTQSSETVYFDMHATHVMANPERVYDQETHQQHGYSVQGMLRTEEHTRPGQLREQDTTVGEFYCVSADQLESLSGTFFSLLDLLRQKSSFIRTLSLEDKLGLHTLFDEFLTDTHLPVNASGRTNEDFLVWIAQEFGYPLTVSFSGFRGQLVDDSEWTIESARWVFRNQENGRADETAKQILSVLQEVLTAVEDEDQSAITRILTDREQTDESFGSQLIAWENMLGREYQPLPTDGKLSQLLALLVAHGELVAYQVYEPRGSKAEEIKQYLSWHQQEALKLETAIENLWKKISYDPFPLLVQSVLTITRNKIDNRLRSLAEQDQLYEEEQGSEITEEQLASLRRRMEEMRQAEEETQKLVEESLREYLEKMANESNQ